MIPANLALYAWPIVVVLLFLLVRPRQAVIMSFLFAWLFLPIANVAIIGLPDLNKMSITAMSALAASLVFDPDRFLRFRPRWYDLPVAIYVGMGFVSSVSNALGPYDGMSASLSRFISMGAPYLVGRLYLGSYAALREFAIWIVVGGLIYVPLCLFEVRMSPQLHVWVYGYFPHSFLQVWRGGWRPTVFMQHGLAVGMWMTTCTLVATWLWMTNSLKHLFQVPMWMVVGALFVTSALLNSMGSFLLLLAGVTGLFWMKYTKNLLPLWGVAALAGVYIFIRAMNWWEGYELVSFMEGISQQRAGSLEFRFRNEVILAEHALERMWFGWAGWGRNRPVDQRTVTDSYWIILFGVSGLVGLYAWFATVALPGVLTTLRVGRRYVTDPRVASAIGLAFVVELWTIDSLVNAMANPMYVLTAGGLMGLGPARSTAKKNAGRAAAKRRPYQRRAPQQPWGARTP
jgi:hypothetical protein